MAYVTNEQLRKMLKRKLADRSQADLSKEIGVKPQNLSIVLKGAPVGGRILSFLGYEKVDGLYRKKGRP
jgi:hypothetical protein